MIVDTSLLARRSFKLEYGEILDSEITKDDFTYNCDYNTLKGLVEHKNSFVLVIRKDHCSCWSAFSPTLAKYINETHAYVNIINDDQLKLYFN